MNSSKVHPRLNTARRPGTAESKTQIIIVSREFSGGNKEKLTVVSTFR